MKQIALAFSATAVLLSLACGKAPEVTPATTTTVTRNAPAWIDTPGVPDGLGDVGYAQANAMGDKGMQRQVALMDGRTKLAAQLKIKVQNMFSQLNQQYTTASLDAAKKPFRAEVMQRMIENVTRNVVSQELQGSTARTSWMDTNGDMYVHIVMSKDTLDMALKNQAAKEIQRELPKGEKALDDALAKLDAVIASSK